jgi:hypothetical protein
VGEGHGEIEHGAIGHAEVGLPVVGHGGASELVGAGGRRRPRLASLDPFVVKRCLFLLFDLGPEIVAVGACSVVAVVGPRDRGSDHLALDATQITARRVHDFHVEASRGGQGLRTDALDPEHLKYPAGALHCLLVQLGEKPGSILGLDDRNPGHGAIDSMA